MSDAIAKYFFGTIRLPRSFIALSILFSLACAGCYKPPQSNIYKNIDLKSIITSTAAGKDRPIISGWSGSEEQDAEFSSKEYHTIVSLQNASQKLYADNIFTVCSNYVVGHGGTISGTEIGESDLSFRRRIKYDTAHTVGKLQFDAVIVADSKVRVSMLVFEGRRVHW